MECVAVTRQQGWLRFFINGIRQYEIDLTAEALNFNSFFSKLRHICGGGTTIWVTRGVCCFGTTTICRSGHITITPICWMIWWT